MGIRFADWRGSANPSPIAMALAEKAGVQQAPQTLQDYKAQQEPSNVAQARMEANTPYVAPEKSKFAPNTDYMSVSMAPRFETKEQAQVRADEADTRAYQQSHPGLSSDFSAKIAEILRQGKQAEQRYRDSAEGKLPAKTMGEIAQERMALIPKEQAWRRQNPFAEGMGYQWADDKTLQGLGWKDDDISSMKARTEFDPQEIQNLYSVGALKAPYAEYLKKQEALRRQAEEEAARAYAEQSSYDYSEPSSYEAPASTPAPQTSYGVGFDQLDSDSMASSAPTQTQHQSIWDGSAIGRFFHSLGNGSGADNVRDYYARSGGLI
jgi:hypothetical protein